MDINRNWNNIELRDWQLQCFRQYVSCNQDNFLMAVTPGGGKTIGALRIAVFLLKATRQVDRIVWVVPSTQYRLQVALAAAEVGLHLDPYFDNGDGVLANDMDGMVVTYQAVCADPAWYRNFVHRHRTFSIFDELHHAGIGLSYGRALRRAFERAVKRVGLSGTPFRSDNNPIPFVDYVDGVSQADFSYSYGKALANKDVRPVFFPQFDGDFGWISKDGQRIEATFNDELTESQRAERLNIALDPKTPYVRQITKAFCDKVYEVRKQGHPDAGGLVVCKDIYSANETAKLIHCLTGRRPPVITSDEPNAAKMLIELRNSDEPIIVSVKMVSEGVDIPRLRVGLYLSNTTTELFWRQFVGRFVRVIRELAYEDQIAYIFIPDDPRIRSMAFAIKEEREHSLREQINDALQSNDGKELTSGETGLPFSAIGLWAEARESGFIADGVGFDQEWLHRARLSKQRNPNLAHHDDTFLAQLLKDLSETMPQQTVSHAHPRVEPGRVQTKADRKQAIRKKGGPITQLAASLCDKTELTQQDIMGLLKRMQGKKQSECSEKELDDRLMLLTSWNQDVRKFWSAKVRYAR